MSDNKTKKRNEIDEKFKWNIEKMYPDESKWEKDLDACEKEAAQYIDFGGRLTESSGTLLEAFKKRDAIWQDVERVYTYARMKKDEDNSNSKYQAMADKSQTMIAKVSASMSFFTPEFLEADESLIRSYLKENDELKQYTHVIEVMLREKDHVLSKPEENIMAQMSEVTSATGDIFTMLNNADIRFGQIKDENGNLNELTHGTYIKYMESKDRTVRKDAYEAMYGAYIKQKNTIAMTYSYNTKADVVTSRIRKYPSALESALSGDNVPVSVYNNLIDIVNDNLPILHRYMDIRKKVLGVDKPEMYDVYVPIVNIEEKKISFDDGVELMKNGLAPLGKEYTDNAVNGVNNGWIDIYENEGKTSGAYSFGSYDSMPYILLNYTDKLKDVFTLVHEMGHSMHSFYTRGNQPFTYGGHSIFTAEVASTVNESLLIDHLIKNAEDENELKYLINMHIEDFRTTLFRQTMFAEFEKLTHEAVESGEVLTSEWLSDKYGQLNAKYFGPQVNTDDNIKMEWARIPHFYRAFYVYKYATGYSAATALSSKILAEGDKAVDDYKQFLKSGDSDDPIQLLKIAGVDMSSRRPIENAMKVFESLVERFEELMR